MKVLTVSVAAYNCEDYIDECLNSFADERFNDTLEVLVINDGSTDGTAARAEAFVKRFPSVYRLVNKANGGHGSTINRGIEEASGVYFRTLDGDDRYDTENLIVLIEKLKTINTDAVISDFSEWHMGNGEIKNRNFPDAAAYSELPFERWPPRDPKCYGLNEFGYHSICYKTEFLREHAISVPEGVFFADEPYFTCPLAFIRTVYYFPKVIYYWRLERPGQSVSLEGMLKYRTHKETVVTFMFNFYETARFISPFNKEYVKWRIIIFLLTAYHEISYIKPPAGTMSEANRAKRALYRKLKKISPELFMSWVKYDKLNTYQYYAGFFIDNFLYRLQLRWRKVKNG